MPKIILTIGVSSSGKSRWAENFRKNDKNFLNLNRDDYRFALFTGGKRDWTQYKFNKANEKRVTEAIDQMAFGASIDGLNLIISDTNLNSGIRDKWKRWAEEFGYEYEEMLFPCDWETLVKRNAQREGGISESLLWSQFLRYEQQFGDIKPYEDDPELEDTIIVDIDGTVASMEGRSPFDWSKVGEDKVRPPILNAVVGMAEVTHDVTFLSGRDGSCYQETLEWLLEQLEGKDKNFAWRLYMREAGDSRKDFQIKDELYEKCIRGFNNVYAVVDDRNQMIRHWTLKGMPNIIDVGNYNEEF